MTKIYFIRHAKPDYTNHDDHARPLTEEGREDCKKVTEFLSDKHITKAFSSPYIRSIDTIKDYTQKAGLKIDIIDDFRERCLDNVWVEDFNAFAKEQWNNFDYKLTNGESLNEVQKRNIAALQCVLLGNANENIVIGTHGTALSTIINYYNNKFDYAEFDRIKTYMPFAVCFEFEGTDIVKIQEFLL